MFKLLTQSGLLKIESSARTFGELKEEPELKKLNIDWSSSKLIDKDSKVSFDLDESVLPAIKCLMFVTPTKTKSGQDLPYKEVKAKLKEYVANGGVLDFNYTQATTAKLNEAWNKVKGKTTVKPEAKKEVSKVVETIKAAKTMASQGNSGLSKEEVQAMIDAQLGKKVEAKPEIVIPKEDSILVKDIAEVITKAELDAEANYLKGKFYK
jgi:S-adenosylmethionine:tRNA-ribosyltransferase-isomerase (queuine synthetase)